MQYMYKVKKKEQDTNLYLVLFLNLKIKKIEYLIKVQNGTMNTRKNNEFKHMDKTRVTI